MTDTLRSLVVDLQAKLSTTIDDHWETKLDEKNGAAYFENTSTGETTWEVPKYDFAKLQQELKSLKQAEKNTGKVQLKESAMKADINKMKAETRQAKKDLSDYKRQADLKCAAATEEAMRYNMMLEDEMMRLVVEHVDIIPSLLKCIRNRDKELADEVMKGFRLMETMQVQPVVDQVLKDVTEEYNAHVEIVASLRFNIRDMENSLAFEKNERTRENSAWSQLVAERDEDIQGKKQSISELEHKIMELDKYITDTETRHADEFHRARQFDLNQITSLKAQLDLCQNEHEEAMNEIANIWPQDIPPPSILRKYVLPIFHQETIDRQLWAQEQLRIGKLVDIWVEDSYHRATITAIAEAMVEVLWNSGSDQPPIWVALESCYAVVEEDIFKQKTMSTQTEIVKYDEWPTIIAPRSARSRLDGAKEIPDRLAIRALKKKAKDGAGDQAENQVRQVSQKLFRMIDSTNHGEIDMLTVWQAILQQSPVRSFIEESDVLAPLKRKEYLVLGWKSVDEDITVPLVLDEFLQVCKHALLLSTRDAIERVMEPIDSLSTVNTIERQESGNDTNEFRANENSGTLLVPWLSEEQIDIEKYISTLQQTRISVFDTLRQEMAQERERLDQLKASKEIEITKLEDTRKETQQQMHLLNETMNILHTDALSSFKELDVCSSNLTGAPLYQQDTLFHSEVDAFSAIVEDSPYHQVNLPSPRKARDSQTTLSVHRNESIKNRDWDRYYSQLDLQITNLNQELTRENDSCEEFKAESLLLEQQLLKEFDEGTNAKLDSIKKSLQGSKTMRFSLQDAIKKLSEGQQTITDAKNQYIYMAEKHSELAATFQSTQERLDVELESMKFWNDELSSEEKQQHGQDQCLCAMDKTQEKLSKEIEMGNLSLKSLIEQREIIHSRLHTATLEMKSAKNEIETKIANERLKSVQKDVDDGLKWIEERWTLEMETRKTALIQQKLHNEQDSIRAQSALNALVERVKLRDLIENGRNNASLEVLGTLRRLACEREEAGMKENLNFTNGLCGAWIAQQERNRYEMQVELYQREAEQSKLHFGQMEEKVTREMKRLQTRYDNLLVLFSGQEESYVNELTTLANTSEMAVNLLHQEYDEQISLNTEIERSSREQLDMMQEDYVAMKITMQIAILKLEDVLVHNRYWIGTLKDECKDLKSELNLLQEKRNIELKEHARKLDETRQELEAMTQHSHRLDNWVNSLKAEVRMLKNEIEAGKQVSQQQLVLWQRREEWYKWEIWKRDETARTLGTNIDFAFAFFTETLSRLSGSSIEYNERLSSNCGIEVLTALSQCSRPEIKQHALIALSDAVCDSHEDLRSLSRKAKDDWKRWVNGIAVVAVYRWRRTQNSPQDIVQIQDIEYGKTVLMSKGEIQVIDEAETLWQVNLPNIDKLGRGFSHLKSGIDMLTEILLTSSNLEHIDLALKTLSVLALDMESKNRMGNIPDIMDMLLYYVVAERESGNPEVEEKFRTCCEFVDEAEIGEIRRHALSTLANILFNHSENQRRFGQTNGIDSLVQLIKTCTDVDVLESSTSVLLNATSIDETNAENLHHAGGVPVLIQLCDSNYGQELLDELGDKIQLNAIQTLINVTKNKSAAQMDQVDVFVKMCFSNSLHVRRVIGSIIANVAMNDCTRHTIGTLGGVEALFSLCDQPDLLTKVN